MKTLLIITTLLLSVNCIAQDSIVDYLLNSKTEFSLDKQMMDTAVINNSDIVFIGESHGFNANHKIAFKLIKDYKEATNFTYLLAEIDWDCAQELNQCISNEDTVALEIFMEDWEGTFGWSKEKYQLYKNIIELNKQYDDKIKYIGVDIPAGGIKGTAKNLCTIMQKYNDKDTLISKLKTKQIATDTEIDYLQKLLKLADTKSYNSNDLFFFKYHLNNIINIHLAKQNHYIQWNKVRDSCLFENYKKLEAHLHLQNQKMIGVWGYEHTFQGEIENTKWFASQLKDKLNKKVFTYNTFYFKGKSMVPEHFLPGFLKVFQLKKKYINVKYQNSDNFAAGKKNQLKVLKSVSSPESITFYNIDQRDSPFRENPILLSPYETTYNTTDIMQGVIIVRNSKPSTPFGSNKK